MKKKLLAVFGFLLCTSQGQADNERFAPTTILPTRSDLSVTASTSKEVKQPVEERNIHIPLPIENPLRARSRTKR
jgi:hypothetical protein